MELITYNTIFGKFFLVGAGNDIEIQTFSGDIEI